MKTTKLTFLLLFSALTILLSCSKDSPKKDDSTSGKTRIFKMVVTTSEPIDPEKSNVSLSFVAINNDLSVKCAANYSNPDDDNASIDEDTLATYGTPITVKSVKPVNYCTVTVAYGGIQEPAPLKLHMDIYYDDKKIDEKDLTLSEDLKATMYNFKANGESITYDTGLQ